MIGIPTRMNACEIRSFTGPKLLPRGLLPFCSALKLKMTVETSFASLAEARWTVVAAEEASSFFPLLFSKDGEDRRTDGRSDDAAAERPKCRTLMRKIRPQLERISAH